MIVRRQSPRTGKWTEKELPITQAEIERWEGGTLIQNVWPNLSLEDREFIKTGYTAEDWAAMFPPEDPLLGGVAAGEEK